MNARALPVTPWVIVNARMRALWPLLVACAILGLLAAVGSALDQTFRYRDAVREFWYGCALFLSIFGGLALGVHAALAPRRALLQAAASRVGVSVAIVLAPTLVGLVGAGLLTLPAFLTGLADRALDSQPFPDVSAVSAFAAFLALGTGAAVSGGAALITLIRSPFVAIPGVMATGFVACGVVAALLGVFGPIDVAVAAPFAGLFAAWIGTALGAVLGIAETNPRTASLRTALSLPSGGIVIGGAALVVAGWASDQPPSSFSRILSVESAPSGPWALMTGELRFSARRHHALVDFEHGRWYRVPGPVQNLAFTPDGREARWVEGGMFRSALVGIDLGTGRRWRCGGLPTPAPLLASDAHNVAVHIRGGVRVIEAESCRTIATASTHWSYAARLEGDRLMLDTQEVRLSDGAVLERAGTSDRRVVRAVSPDGTRALLNENNRLVIRDEANGQTVSESLFGDSLAEAAWLAGGRIVTLGGGLKEVRAFDETLVELPLPPRGVATASWLQSGPGPDEVLVCGGGGCDLLNVSTRTWLHLSGPSQPGAGRYSHGEIPTPTPSQYARDYKRGIYRVGSSGAVPVALP